MSNNYLFSGGQLKNLFQKNENEITKKDFLRNQAANPIARVGAWGVDLAVCGVLSTLVSKILGSNFQDSFSGPILIYIVCSFFYGSILECSPWQATLGKHILRMKVIRIDGHSLSIWHSMWRNFLRATVFLSVGISYLLSFLNPQHAAAHDFLSFTRVVKNKAQAPHGILWKPVNYINYFLPFIFTLLSLCVVMIILAVTLSIANLRSQVYSGYKLLKPYMDKVEKEYKTNKSYPESVTEDSHGIKDDDLLPGSQYKATYIKNLGQFTLEVPNIKGKLAVGYFPENHKFNEKSVPAWTCIGRANDKDYEILYSLLSPSDCSLKPFESKNKLN